MTVTNPTAAATSGEPPVLRPSPNRYLAGNFAPVTEEVTATDLAVTGTLPPELNGRYLRIGPNPLGAQDPAAYHWFTGDGMAHGVRLRAGAADWYRNRWIRSTPVSEALGEAPAPGPRHANFDGANTNIIAIGGRTHAIVEAGGRPVELSDELETVRHTDFEGTLPHGFTAHPKLDPATGELHAMNYYWGRPNIIEYVVVGADGKVRRTVDLPVPGSPMVHDMSLTEHFVVAYDLPVTFDLDAAMAGTRLPYSWNPDYGARVGVLPREADADAVRWFEVDPCFVYHPLNSYDDGDRIVLDVVRHPSMFETDKLGPNEGPPSLWRWTVDLSSGKVDETQLDDRAMEFPRVDERVVGRPHRYGYTVSLAPKSDGISFDGSTVAKYDVVSGTSESHDFGPGRAAGEAVFVPRDADAAEDDGWVMAFVYDAATDRSDLMVLSAQDITGDPVAVVHLPVRVPFGFHGNFIPDPA